MDIARNGFSIHILVIAVADPGFPRGGVNEGGSLLFGFFLQKTAYKWKKLDAKIHIVVWT